MNRARVEDYVQKISTRDYDEKAGNRATAS